MEISIVIVNFKSVNLAIDCISSIYNSTFGIDYEIILVNNAVDEDHVNRIGNVFLGKVKLIIINNDKNLGFAIANNQGIKLAKGKYILLLNNDTLFVENTLRIIYDFIESQSNELLIGCKLLNADSTHQISIGKFDTLKYLFSTNFFLYKIFPNSEIFNKYYQNYSEIIEPVETDVIKGAFMFVSNSNMKKLNGFDESFFFYGEETDFCYRFKKQGGKVLYFPKTSIIHLDGASTENIPWFKYRYQAISKLKTYRRQFSTPKYIIALLFHYCGLILRIPIYFIGGILLKKKYLITKSIYYFKQIFIFP